MIQTIVLLVIANIFMTFAWYGHLKEFAHKPLYFVILLSWSVAFFEYCFQVPANRIGFQFFSLAQLKILQELITLAVYAAFSLFYFKTGISKNFIYASLCLMLAAFFLFRDFTPSKG